MKPTKQQILDEPAGPKLDAWFDKLVMKRNREDWELAIENYSPSTKIAHAMEGVEQFEIFLLYWIKKENLWICVVYDPRIETTAKTKELAITRARLLWAIEKEE